MAQEHVVALEAHALAQHGLVTTEQAVAALGLSRKNRWVAEGRLASVQPSVFRMAGSPATWHQSLRALTLASGGIVSHRSAAELWGLLEPEGHLEVSVTPDVRPRVRPPAVVHRIKDLRPDLAEEREGFAVTDAVRTLLDLGLVVPSGTVAETLTRGISTKLLTLAEARWIREALGRRGRNGTGVLGQVVDIRVLAGEKAESELERRFLRLRERYDLPELVLQHEVWAAGRFVARIDAAEPRLLLAIEVDGYLHHSTPEAFQRDRTRQNRLAALGWTVLRFTWADITQRPAEVAATIRESIRRLAAA